MTQVLSHSLAAGISTMVTLRAVDPAAVETALFVKHMDKLFNTLRAVDPAAVETALFVKHMDKLFNTLRAVDPAAVETALFVKHMDKLFNTLRAVDPAAVETALFVKHMDKLFNTFNSNSFTSNQRVQHSFRFVKLLVTRNFSTTSSCGWNPLSLEVHENCHV